MFVAFLTRSRIFHSVSTAYGDVLDKMKFISLTVILTCCLVHAHSDCTDDQATVVKQQWKETFESDIARLLQFGRMVFDRSAVSSAIAYCAKSKVK